ncbi:hypothetical protein [Nodosilinea sp. P-1105]|uniref:hypothetical protein n=1 Tax=Nodosilinea sp. P-1105 TaxID=2546229 RepID=UPI00146C96A1|nr:hypothetical protein [Nodosilinea sp. P-1105]NMF85293.1 hypothetical protein [Nodosilinea sp. P-1105]
MASSSPLTGVILIDCARANATRGLAIAAHQCGYGDDIAKFQAALRSACEAMNVSVDDFADLVADEPPQLPRSAGIEVAPDTPDDL